MVVNNITEIERGSKMSCVLPPCGSVISHKRGSTLFLISWYTLLYCVENISESCGYVGQSGRTPPLSIKQRVYRCFSHIQVCFVQWCAHRLMCFSGRVGCFKWLSKYHVFPSVQSLNAPCFQLSKQIPTKGLFSWCNLHWLTT